jgi:hypothetical protein
MVQDTSCEHHDGAHMHHHTNPLALLGCCQIIDFELHKKNASRIFTRSMEVEIQTMLAGVAVCSILRVQRKEGSPFVIFRKGPVNSYDQP